MRSASRIAMTASLAFLLAAPAIAAGQATAPDRLRKPPFRSEQGGLRSPEVAFDPATNTVTLKLSVGDFNGFVIPNLRRHNFAVYEDGIRQHSVNVEIEHAPIALAVLIEMGGRSQQLNHVLADQASYIARPVLDGLGRDDRLALFTYDDQLHTVLDFDSPREQWAAAFDSLPKPKFSEANFYDAAVAVLDRLASVSGRKALLVVSTGIDTFSHRTFDDVLKKAEAAKTPVYVIGIGEVAQQAILDVGRGPLARVDWKTCARQLEALARTSGGRAYVDATTVAAPAIYEDIMENLRVRYVITYVSSESAAASAPRKVEVKLVDPKTGAPLRITDASGRLVAARAIAEASYTPAAASISG